MGKDRYGSYAFRRCREIAGMRAMDERNDTFGALTAIIGAAGNIINLPWDAEPRCGRAQNGIRIRDKYRNGGTRYLDDRNSFRADNSFGKCIFYYKRFEAQKQKVYEAEYRILCFADPADDNYQSFYMVLTHKTLYARQK